LLRLICKDVTAHKFNSATRRRYLPGNANCLRVQIQPRQPHLDSALSRPERNLPQRLAISASNVQDSESPARSGELFKPLQRRPMAAQPPIHPRQVAKTSAQIVATARPVHQFGKVGGLGAPAQIRKVTRHERASSPPLLRVRTTWRNPALLTAPDASVREAQT
jgi:hypothetical protein